MTVNVDKTAGLAAELSWQQADDPHGEIARAIEGDGLAYLLEALGGGSAEEGRSVDQDRQAAYHVGTLVRLLERRAALQVVRLRVRHNLSWREIAGVVYQDPARQSSARRAYESGLRHLGLNVTVDGEGE